MRLDLCHYLGPIPHDGLCCLVIDRDDRTPCPNPAAYYATVADERARRSTAGACEGHAAALRSPRPQDLVYLLRLRSDDPVRGPIPATSARSDSRTPDHT